MGLGSKPGAVDAGVGWQIVQRFELFEPAFLCSTDMKGSVGTDFHILICSMTEIRSGSNAAAPAAEKRWLV